MTPEGLHTCTRVYNNGDPVTEYRMPTVNIDMDKMMFVDLRTWIQQNTRMRPGCALFVDGNCIQWGYLGRERCDAISTGLKWNEGAPT